MPSASDEVVTQAPFGRRSFSFSSPFGNKNIHRITATGGEHIRECLGTVATSTWLELNIRKRPTTWATLAIPSQAEGTSSLDCFYHCGWAVRPQGRGLIDWWSPHPLPQEALTAPMSCSHPWGWDGHNLLRPVLRDKDKALGTVSGSLTSWKLKGIWRILSRLKTGVRVMGDPKGTEMGNRVKECPELHTPAPIPSLFLPQNIHKMFLFWRHMDYT